MADIPIKARVLEFLKAKKLTQTEFCNRMGVCNTYVGAMRKGMAPDKIKRMCEIFPDLNRDWLVYGEGEMLRNLSEQEDKGISRDYETLLLPVDAFAGDLQLWSDGVRATDCRRIVSPVSGADFAIPIKGDSMEPRFHDGSLLLIKKINDKAFIPWGHTLVVDTENGVYIKNLLPDDKSENGFGEEYVIARSINPNYPPFRIPISSIYGIYRVMGTIDIYTAI